MSEAEEEKKEAKLEETSYPIFEVIIQSSLVTVGVPLHHFKIWSDGRVEGFEKLSEGKAVVVNRIPMLLAGVVEPIQGFIESVKVEIARMSESGVLMQPVDPGPNRRLDS